MYVQLRIASLCKCVKKLIAYFTRHHINTFFFFVFFQSHCIPSTISSLNEIPHQTCRNVGIIISDRSNRIFAIFCRKYLHFILYSNHLLMLKKNASGVWIRYFWNVCVYGMRNKCLKSGTAWKYVKVMKQDNLIVI